MSETRKGLLYGVLAYGLWGLIPAYWKLLSHVSAVELIAHRALWGVVTFGLFVAIAGQGNTFRDALRNRQTVATMTLSGALLALNWTTFVYATTTGRLLEASLGYFINPLLSVALGTLVLREKLRKLQWVAIALAGFGVAMLTVRTGRLPWISLVLACTFGIYGLVRKTARVDALVGSTLETVLMIPIAMAYLTFVGLRGSGALGHASAATHLLIAGTGLITAVPLVLFTSSARRLPLSTVGFLQYLAPTGQFLLAVLAYGEPLARDRLAAFVLIWVGLIAFSVDLWRQRNPSVA